MADRVRVREISDEEGNRLLDCAPRFGVGGDLAAGADRVALGAGDAGAAHRGGEVHLPPPGPRCDPQLRPRRGSAVLHLEPVEARRAFRRAGVVEDISHEGLRLLLRTENVFLQRLKTWETSTNPDYETKKNRGLELHAIADGERPRARATPRSCSVWTSSGR